MPHETADTSCPKCGSDTIEDPKTFLTCPKCGAKGSWFDMYGSTDQGFHDGPITWERVGWVATSAGAPPPHIAVVGWYGRDELMVLVHDGQQWTATDGTVPAPLYWLSLPPDPQ